ncbi:MAG: hypothetical protein IH946_05965, partial [Bacteroidetes bacterium]|nr:hypothetical protein [Bacteroidota bacterium]
MTRSFAILLSCLISFSSVAEIRKYSNEFLAIGIGARALGMSGAQVASVSDVTGGFWNPAGLLGMTEHNIQVGAMHTEYFAGIAKYDYGALAVPLKDKNRVVGISIIRFGVDDIPNTLHLIEPDGSINYDNIVAFSAADYAFMGSYAQKISEGFRVGGTAKIIHRKVGTFGTAWGFGIDIGAQYDYNDFTFGVLGKDITGTYNAWTTSFTQEEKEILQLTGNELPGNSLEVTAPKVIIGAAWHKELDNKISLLGE